MLPVSTTNPRIHISSLLSIFILVLFIQSCKQQKNVEGSDKGSAYSKTMDSVELHWNYEGETGPENWARIEEFSVCDGMAQSPINIVNYEKSNTREEMRIFYADSTHIHNVINNGHTIQYNFEAGDYIEVDGKRFNLKQFHFHEPAEHLIEGIRYPMVIHLVHQNTNGNYAVLAVMAREEKSSEPFDFLERYLPIKHGDTILVDLAFDMNLNLPATKAYFSYTGSLTTPPCTENVKWFIFKEPITVSLEQVEALKKLMPLNNYRNEQPRNNRVILLSEYAYEKSN